MGHPSERVRPNADFARRLAEACDTAGVPPRNHGRLKWLREEMAQRFGETVTVECIRKWLAGETLPRPANLKRLAELLGVADGWLYSGPGGGVEEKTTPFDHSKWSPGDGDRGRFILERIRQRLGGTVTVMPGVDLTEPTGEVWDAERD